ncbi:DUF2975 domain-containing protein [Aurantiacibacter gilvus]|uniref:DUF2975 domain-containing protein n=1 Tax=Aurantiacibacter gilvus TaxID=3139141 RepID=A0ABU9IGM4_9SPHN
MTMPPSARPNDLLLLAGKVLSIFLQSIMALASVVLVIAVGALLVMRGTIIAEYAEHVGDPEAVFPVFAAVGVVLIGLAIVASLFVFFGKLRRIIATVGEGDPFVPANADRLNQMGWLMLGVRLLMFPAMALGTWLASYADEMEDVHFSIEGGLDLSGILLVIILFILARVFRHGAAMREDLEGTV